MKRDIQGYYCPVTTVGEKVQAFIPAPLPPSPPIEWSPELRDQFDKALLALGRLDGISELLPDTSLFLYMYIRKEAVLSSMIEGTQSSLSDLLLFESQYLPGVPLDDVQEVSNYVAALNHGLNRLSEGFPLSLRLLKEIHRVLLSKGRGQECQPGEFRRSQNWIGGTRPDNALFVPPPHDQVPECMGKLELFLHDQQTSVLVKAALAHLQFETIHPFLDGNGRLGRLLITLLLCSNNVLNKPMLYLSLYFKTYRQQYYQLLNEVRLTGDWESWLEFFAKAVIETTGQAIDTIQQLTQLIRADGKEIDKLSRISSSVHTVHQAMIEKPITSPNRIQEKTQLSYGTVNTGLQELEKLGIIKEITGKKRNRLYAYSKYIDIIKQGTELP